MKKTKWEQGSVNVLLVPVILITLLFIAATIFGVWAFGSRQDYKDNSDAKAAAAVAANKTVVQAADAKLYAEASKSPLKTYVGPDAYGSIHVSYPKTWSAYIDTTDSGTPVNAYFHDDYVPAVTDDPNSAVTYNLRLQVIAQSYDQTVSAFTSADPSTFTAVPYTLPKMPKVTGTKLTGSVFPDNASLNGTLIVLPLRDKTIEIWTESSAYMADFTNYILPNLTFSP